MFKSDSIIQRRGVISQTLKTAILILLITMIYVGCTSITKLRPVTDIEKIPNVNVLIHKAYAEINLTSTDKLLIKDVESMKLIDSLDVNQNVVIQYDTNKNVRLIAGEKFISGHKRILLIPAQKNNLFKINDRQYRGQILITQIDTELALINTLDLESYVKGVVRNEIGNLPKEHIEAAKAQAVAARTYAVRNIGKTKREYDMVSDVFDQVYRGAGSETDVSNTAVDETSGEILEYQGKPAQVFYYSTCGGVTANVQDVWTSSDTIPYLQSFSTRINNDYLCKNSPHFRWTLSWTGEELENNVKTNLPALLKKNYPNEDFSKLDGQRLYNVAVLERDSSQRVKKLKIGFQKDEYVISGEQARKVLKGPKTIFYSSLFRIDVERNQDGTIKKADCTGAGFGHGIGMCQWCSIKMAAERFSYSDILMFFYRGLKINRIY